MRILVTGAAGVMGMRLVRALAARGHAVRAMVLPGDPLRSRLDGVTCEIVDADLQADGAAQPALVRACAGADTVFHLAAVIIADDPAVFRRVNDEGTARLVRAAAGVRHFVYVSSASVTYPRLTPYGVSKRNGEEHVRGGAFAHTIVRPTLVYDEHGGQEFRMFLDFLRRWPVVPFIGPGTARKRPVFAGDVVDALVAIAGNPRTHGKTYALGGGEAIGIGPLARLMLQHHGASRPFVHLPAGVCRLAASALARVQRNPVLTAYVIAGMINDADLDPAEACRDLGWRPLGVREGFRRCFPLPGVRRAVTRSQEGARAS